MVSTWDNGRMIDYWRAHGFEEVVLVDASDFIFCMTRSHCEQVHFLSAEAQKECSLLARDDDIPDPIGRPQERFDRCADMIEAAVKARVSELVI